jgi:hypothetical protein
MRRSLASLLAAASLAAAVPAAHAAARADRADHPVAVAAKTCSAGYTHAVIGGQEKCLRRGEYCAARYARQYRRYGYRCVYGRLR